MIRETENKQKQPLSKEYQWSFLLVIFSLTLLLSKLTVYVVGCFLLAPLLYKTKSKKTTRQIEELKNEIIQLGLKLTKTHYLKTKPK